MRFSLKMPSMAAGAALAAATLLAGAPSANATFVLGTGNLGSLGDNVIASNSCVGNATGPGTTVQGCLNTSHTTLVDVSTVPPPATANLTANGGQARFEGSDGTTAANISNFAINMSDPTLGIGGLVFNINAQNHTTSTVTFTVNAVDALGNVEAPATFTETLSGSGSNFFNFTTADGEVATSISASSSLSNIVDIRQVRLIATDVPTPPTPTPEPASLALLGTALAGFGFLRRRKRA
jgi:hypothetical protein